MQGMKSAIKAYLIALHILCAVLFGMLLEMFSLAQAPSFRGLVMLAAAGAGTAVVIMLIGCLGLFYRENRLAGFFVGSWLAAIIMAAGFGMA